MPSNILRITERVVGFIVLVICILLIFQNKELKKRLELGGISGKSIYEPLERGNNVPPADCFEIDGTRSTLKYTDGYEKYLLFVFSTQCPHCEQSLPVIKRIAGETVDNNVELIGISMHDLHETQTWAMDRQVNFRVLHSSGIIGFQESQP